MITSALASDLHRDLIMCGTFKGAWEWRQRATQATLTADETSWLSWCLRARLDDLRCAEALRNNGVSIGSDS